METDGVVWHSFRAADTAARVTPLSFMSLPPVKSVFRSIAYECLIYPNPKLLQRFVPEQEMNHLDRGQTDGIVNGCRLAEESTQ